MDKNYKSEIEKVFRESSSTNELFDAFHFALSQKISDLDSYKILLANPALSKDELILFTEKLCTVLKDKSYDVYTWSAGILENKTTDMGFIEDAVSYYIKAAQTHPAKHEPFINLIKLYNFDINFPTNRTILNFITNSLNGIEYKSKVYYALADLYKTMGDNKLMLKYKKSAEKSAHEENQ